MTLWDAAMCMQLEQKFHYDNWQEQSQYYDLSSSEIEKLQSQPKLMQVWQQTKQLKEIQQQLNL